MAHEGMKRVLERHAALLKQWRKQLADLESGRIVHATKVSGGTDWHDDTADRITVLKRDIAMVEAIDEQYRP